MSLHDIVSSRLAPIAACLDRVKELRLLIDKKTNGDTLRRIVSDTPNVHFTSERCVFCASACARVRFR